MLEVLDTIETEAPHSTVIESFVSERMSTQTVQQWLGFSSEDVRVAVKLLCR